MLGAGVGRNILILWGNAEPSGEMTKFMALTREEGSFFYTVSPDPVHNIATIQWPAPFTRSRGHQSPYTSSRRSRGVACWTSWRRAARPTSMGDIG